VDNFFAEIELVVFRAQNIVSGIDFIRSSSIALGLPMAVADNSVLAPP
jgi:hypothetical protein